MSKHTPGPWNAFKYPDVKSWTVAAKESIASKIKTEQDANLIAAAPEMLAALEIADMVISEAENRTFGKDLVTVYFFEQHDIDLIKTAIKKAKGEP